MRILRVSVLLLASLTALQAWGHHASPAYDAKKMMTLEGTLTKVEWANPHVQLYFDQKDHATGQVQAWRIEMESPKALQEQGLGRDVFKIGLDLTLTGIQVKPRTHVIWPLELKMPDDVHWAARITSR